MKHKCIKCQTVQVVMASKQVCLACFVFITHVCPVCHETASGSGRGPCYPCRHRLGCESQFATETATISHLWLRDLFTAFCKNECVPVVEDGSRNLIARAAAACRRIADGHPNPASLTIETVYAALGVEDLRRVAPFITYMADRGIVDWDRARLQALIQFDRVAAILRSHDASPHADLLHRYRDNLTIRDRKPITQVRALTAGIALLSELKGAPLAELSGRHITSSLRRHPKNRALLADFLRFIADQGGPRLNPRRSRAGAVMTPDQKQQIDTEAWRNRLEKPRSTVEAMALLAGLIARTADLSVGRVLTLRRDEVSVDEQDVILWPGSMPMTLDSHLANAFRSWATHRRSWLDPRGPWVFPGRSERKPLSESTVYAHLKGKHIRTTSLALRRAIMNEASRCLAQKRISAKRRDG